jgi:hypothetical protein
MSALLRLEELFFFFLSIYLFSRLGIAWWWYPLLFLAPDLAMLGYAFGPRWGAVIYNLVHHKGISIGLYILGAILQNPILQLAALILLGHSSLDRTLGYGLKYSDAFQHTHLGMIGKT